jgi:hypothetical protein
LDQKSCWTDLDMDFVLWFFLGLDQRLTGWIWILAGFHGCSFKKEKLIDTGFSFFGLSKDWIKSVMDGWILDSFGFSNWIPDINQLRIQN